MICLALNVYHEARGEPERGQVAVALVTLNRSKRTGKDVCTVVAEPNQFSWTRDKVPQPKGKAWQVAKKLARTSLSTFDFTHGSEFFHTLRVSPYWSRIFKRTIQVGNHVFYKR